MIGLLQSILCAIENIAYRLLGLVIDGINAVISGLGLLISGAVALMPSMDALGEPDVPDLVETVASWVAWVFPVGTVVDILTLGVVIWLAWQLVAILLRWAKATDQ